MKTRPFSRIFFGVYIYALIFYVSWYVVTPKILEKRLRDLNLMEYNGEQDKFVGKDSVVLNKWDIYYIQHGNFEE